ncbi:MAG: hypothetical protein A3G43_10445 [Ignavibacteria bacterium RIFCSPLOWO2_12_FULL_56_21]|nr:MAG: hypothetical protein A3G43_10445 [Ignavibacteria bacterium RIFCSPLOWO2_12_FULL_56_21]
MKGMHMKHLLASCAVAAALLVAGCKKGADLPPVAEWEQFSDPFFRTTFLYPKAWQVQKDPTRVTITTSMEAMEKFFDPYSKKPAGSQLIISGERTDSVSTLEAVFEQYKKGLTEQGFEITSEKRVTVDGIPAIEIAYGGRFDEQTTMRAIRALAYKDTTTYVVHYAGFNEFFEPYRAVYDSAIASVVLPKPKVASKLVDPAMPVEETQRYTSDVVDFAYPENFGVTIGKPSGEVVYSTVVKGSRDDIKITLDVRPAKGVSLDKIVVQNTKNLSRSSAPSNATISGVAAKSVSYAPTRGIDGRMYFVVKNDKFYRIIMFWPTSLKKEVLPPLEKTIASLQLK